MDMKQIKELIAAMEKSGMSKVRIKEEKGFELELERHPQSPPPQMSATQEAPSYFPPSSSPPLRPHAEEQKLEIPQEGTFITSEMVGTFYTAPSPDDPPYVKKGDQVDENTVVCIIEAMKVMNDVKAKVKGRIVEVFVENGEPVEFGTQLFRVV